MGSSIVGVPQVPRGARLLPVRGVASRFLPWKRLERLNASVSAEDNGPVFSRILRSLGVRYNVSDSDLAHVSHEQALLVVANHPFGLLDGVIACDALLRVRPDVKILTNWLLSEIPSLAPYCIFVDPFGTKESVRRSRQGLREALRWLKSGGVLVVFPAGEVSHWKFTRPVVTESAMVRYRP